ncbi:MAG: hypothetical protein M1814_004796 [Vezdaea aestivalis]|nr:MAG: hypothetical protein M1814_004796 [Vezdaea aestivalis]
MAVSSAPLPATGDRKYQYTKERPFKCMKCRSTFVRRDLLLRHDRTVHGKDGGIPLHSEVKRRTTAKTSPIARSSKSGTIDTATLEQIEASSDGLVDLETAAMLITDLQHKATVLENTVAPWDFMPHSAVQPKAHSIASSAAASHDSQSSQPSMTTASTIQPSSANQAHPGQLRFGSDASILTHTLSKTMSASGAMTPGAYSPYGYLPASPLEYRRSPAPQINGVTPPRAPAVDSDDERNIILDNIRETDKERAIMDTFKLPSQSQLNKYLKEYFGLFHHHLPFIHPASFKPTQMSPSLLLAVLSIGALYTFDQEHAYMLHIGSKVLVNQFLQNKENFSSRKCPLWAMQSSLLNMMFASWSGDPKGLEWACSIKGLLANMVAGNRYELKLRTDAREGSPPTREEWVIDEGCRRTYYAVYVFFGLLTLTYNHTPAINFNEFDSLELPSSESLWNLDDAEEQSWRERLDAATVPSFREAHDNLFKGEPAKYSAFATRVMINALFMEVWYHKRRPEALQDVVTEYKLRLALETWEKALDLCEAEILVVPLSAPHKGHPLIFNAMAMYRNTRARLEVDLKSVQEALRYHDPFEVAAAMINARDKVKRSQEMTKVIQECYNCLEIATAQGLRWVARTSATNWSIEHPLCGMDLMVILSLWLYRLEHDEEDASEEEMNMYNKVRSLFPDDATDVENPKLSTTVARAWGGLLEEVVVWGITRLLGEAFNIHAQALSGYDDAIASGSSTPSATMPGSAEYPPPEPSF